MKTKPITEYNKKALIDIATHLEFSDWDKEPVIQKMTYTDFNDIGMNLKIILDAIEFIGFNGNETNLVTCAGLAQIANKLIPLNELDFLDRLLVVKENYKGDKLEFSKI